MRWLIKKLTSHTLGGWKVQDQGAGRFGVWWGSASLSKDGCLLAVPSHGRMMEIFLTLFYKGTTPLHEGCPLQIQSLCRVPIFSHLSGQSCGLWGQSRAHCIHPEHGARSFLRMSIKCLGSVWFHFWGHNTGSAFSWKPPKPEVC